jgi:hypothetical protein
MKVNHFFNTIRFQFFGTVFLFLGSFFFKSCNDGAPFGMEIQPEDELIGVFNTTDFSISAETIEDTSTFFTNGGAVQLLGYVNDPQFGTVEAIPSVQLRLNTIGITIDNPENFRIDSSVLSLQFINAYGDLSVNSFSVYELDEAFEANVNYSADTTLAVKPDVLGSTQIIDLSSIGDSISGLLDIDSNSISEPAQLRMRLNNAFGKHLLVDGSSRFGSQDDFQDFFKGFTIQPNSNDYTGATGSILYINTNGQYSRLQVYVTDTVNNTRSLFAFPINSECIRYTKINFNHSVGEVNAFFNSKELGKDSLFLQALRGTRARLTIADFKSAFQDSLIMINKATLTIPVAAESEDFPSAIQLAVFKVAESGGELQLADYFETSDHYGGRLDSDSSHYQFTITRFLQEEFLNNTDSLNLYLGINPSILFTTASRTVVKGSNNIELKVYYTPLK